MSGTLFKDIPDHVAALKSSDKEKKSFFYTQSTPTADLTRGEAHRILKTDYTLAQALADSYAQPWIFTYDTDASYDKIFCKNQGKHSDELMKCTTTQDTAPEEGARLESVDTVEIVKTGLHIERDPLEVKFFFKDTRHLDQQRIDTVRQQVRDDLDQWRIRQFGVFSKLVYEVQAKVQVNPADGVLLLLSNFSKLRKMSLALGSAEKAEQEYRMGQARNCLEDVRKAVQKYNHIIALQVKEVHTPRQTTRAQNIIDDLVSDVRKIAYHYNKTRQGLLNLDVLPDHPIIPELHDNAKNAAFPARLGTSIDDPWFWHVACFAGTSSTLEID